MKFTIQNILVLKFVIIFFIGLGSSITINMQYGLNSSFNEIEHTDKNPTNTLNEIIEEHAKLCEKLIDFDFSLLDFDQNNCLDNATNFKDFILLSNPTPPPEVLV